MINWIEGCPDEIKIGHYVRVTKPAVIPHYPDQVLIGRVTEKMAGDLYKAEYKIGGIDVVFHFYFAKANVVAYSNDYLGDQEEKVVSEEPGTRVEIKMNAQTFIGAAVLLGTMCLAVAAGLVFGAAGFFAMIGVMLIIIAWICLMAMDS